MGSVRSAAKKTTRSTKKSTTKSSTSVPRAVKKTTGTALLVVESPSKAKTLKKYLGAGYVVQASVGHIKDLPKSKIGVDVEQDFAPHYEVIRGKSKIISDLKKSAKQVDVVYLAPDPDREGEAIAWHLAEELRPSNGNIQRVLFNEITPRGVKESMAHPTQLDPHKYDAQQSRRILDRLVGYQISPLLWSRVQPGLSAGRVQSVAVRIIVDREEEIARFVSVEYWSIEAALQAALPPTFHAKLVQKNGKKIPIFLGDEAKQMVATLKKTPFVVQHIEKKERRRFPAAPFTTSKLQQEAAHKLRFSAKKTMMLAQRLYEGVDLGKAGTIGLITYMRTDSTRLSNDAVQEARDYIQTTYGTAYLPPQPVVYRSKKASAVQDAHEAIRPTLTTHTPDKVKALMQQSGQDDYDDLFRLYQLIWNRFVACQMKPAVYDQTTVDIEAGVYGFRASGQVLLFPGFTALYEETVEKATPAPEDAESAESGDALPPLKEGDRLQVLELTPNQHFTQPPPRFSEASLVKELEEKGIGRPSTYATILSTIQDRGYVEKKESRFVPTDLGKRVNNLLVQSFPDILNVEFTAQMEEQLDSVEEGKQEMRALLQAFYGPFQKELSRASTEMKNLRAEQIPTDITCEKCQRTMAIKWGRNGEFLACTGYPECKNTKEFSRDEHGKITVKQETTTSEICPDCSAPMNVKRGRFGEFLACSRYPACKHTQPITLGIVCPRPGCGGMIAEKRSKRGKVFYGCSNFSKTQCDFVSWDRPVKQTCPQCKAPFLLKKESRRGERLSCASCNFSSGAAETDPDAT